MPVPTYNTPPSYVPLGWRGKKTEGGDEASILWETFEYSKDVAFRFEAVVLHVSVPPPPPLPLQLGGEESSSSSGINVSVAAAAEAVNNEEDKEFLFISSIFFMYEANCGGGIDYASPETEETDGSGLIRFRGHPSYGGNSTTVPNVPVGMAAYLLSWGLPISFLKVVFRGISDSVKKLFIPSTSTTTAPSVVLVNIAIVSLHQQDENFLDTKVRSLMDADDRFPGALPFCEDEAQLYSPICQKILHNSGNNGDIITLRGDNGDDDDDCCSICLKDPLTARLAKLPCSHVYHYDCIIKWLWRSNRCPLCRAAYRRA